MSIYPTTSTPETFSIINLGNNIYQSSGIASDDYKNHDQAIIDISSRIIAEQVYLKTIVPPKLADQLAEQKLSDVLTLFATEEYGTEEIDQESIAVVGRVTKSEEEESVIDDLAESIFDNTMEEWSVPVTIIGSRSISLSQYEYQPFIQEILEDAGFEPSILNTPYKWGFEIVGDKTGEAFTKASSVFYTVTDNKGFKQIFEYRPTGSKASSSSSEPVRAEFDKEELMEAVLKGMIIDDSLVNHL
jgi:hypothetical protein